MQSLEQYLESSSTSCTLMIRFPDWHKPQDDRFILVSVFDADSEEEHIATKNNFAWAEMDEARAAIAKAGGDA